MRYAEHGKANEKYIPKDEKLVSCRNIQFIESQNIFGIS